MNWQPSKCLEDPQEYQQKYATGTDGKFALIILNQPILIHRTLFENVWHNATYRFCADGGANRLYDLLETDEERAKFLPDYVRGDLDSLRDSVKEYYQSMGVTVERVPDQDSTDFMKCVELVRARDPSHSITTTTPTSLSSDTSVIPSKESSEHLQASNLGIIALGGTGGRFDQSMSSIHHLYILNQERNATLISDESIVILLGPGTHEITCSLEIEGPTCGIIPVGSSEAILTTTGLKWDIEDWKTSFGTQVSTSNALVGSKVTIKTTAPVVWTTEVRSI
ncbi:cAMP-dependent protein kinase subunit [Mortierella sp. GBA35]|nr:cAMP-dependent protein kinase subunit [Mortierella sp. AD031]KAF9104472.1 cAMP-dependent protein kinase subunit [Mortierella sp. GBA35]KAG0203678.1 cAMP-dependent protein kinase subunit [Mortierella sp. NVP41]